MKKIKKFIIFLFVICIASFLFMGYLGYDKYTSALTENPLEEKVQSLRESDRYTPISQIPETFKNAMVAVEDRRFYLHNGFDIIGTGRAIITDIKNKSLDEGGSTISQQLAKNMYFPLDKTPTRKLAEIFMALKLEREFSKDEILELYFNVIYYGKGCYNIHDAAKKYFNKSPIEMTDYESTLLAGIPNAPSVYSNNPTLAAKRQQKVLKAMFKAGYIEEEDIDKILEMKERK